ncbi:MAG: hypothetical protein ACOCV3_02550 [Halanaerobiales bacterium]
MKGILNLRKILSLFLLIMFLANFMMIPILGDVRVEAGFWDNNKGNILTIVKGIIMFWIISIMTQNSSDGDENIITSTIKQGLNIGDDESKEEEDIEIEEFMEYDLR